MLHQLFALFSVMRDIPNWHSSSMYHGCVMAAKLALLLPAAQTLQAAGDASVGSAEEKEEAEEVDGCIILGSRPCVWGCRALISFNDQTLMGGWGLPGQV